MKKQAINLKESKVRYGGRAWREKGEAEVI